MASSRASTPVAGPSRQPLNATGRRRLPEEATLILTEFFENESRSPNITQRKELLVQVNKVPSAEWYTLANVHNWFIARSKKKKRSDDDALGGTDQILWPSLDSSKIRKLEVLLNDTPAPTRIHLQVWSRTLHAEQMHVENWVQLHQTQAIQPTQNYVSDQGQLYDHSALPTPEGTASPEVQSPRTPDVLGSPLTNPSTLIQQTYVGYGTVGRIGPSDTHSDSPQAPASFIAVRPSSSATVYSSGPSETPDTPASPMSVPSPAAGEETEEDELDSGMDVDSPATTAMEEEVDELRSPTPVPTVQQPPLPPPDTTASSDAGASDDAEIAVEAMTESYSQTTKAAPATLDQSSTHCDPEEAVFATVIKPSETDAGRPHSPLDLPPHDSPTFVTETQAAHEPSPLSPNKSSNDGFHTPIASPAPCSPVPQPPNFSSPSQESTSSARPILQLRSSSPIQPTDLPAVPYRTPRKKKQWLSDSTARQIKSPTREPLSAHDSPPAQSRWSEPDARPLSPSTASSTTELLQSGLDLLPPRPLQEFISPSPNVSLGDDMEVSAAQPEQLSAPAAPTDVTLADQDECPSSSTCAQRLDSSEVSTVIPSLPIIDEGAPATPSSPAPTSTLTQETKDTNETCIAPTPVYPPIPYNPSLPLPMATESASSSSTSDTQTLPTQPQPTIPASPQRKFSWTSLRDAIRAEFARTPSPPPTTLAELGERLEPLVLFCEAVERGEYAHIGLMSSKRPLLGDDDNRVGSAGAANDEGKEMMREPLEEGEIMDVDG